MNKKYFIFLFLVLVLFRISASCSDGQIDINTATFEELDKLSGIGPVKAQAIINSRSFNSLDDLLNVYGIGEVTLENIKTQGFACVDGEIITEEKIEPEKASEEMEPVINKNNLNANPSVINLTPINTKDIKTNEDKKTSGKIDYAKYGFVIFCIFIGVLFILKNKNKNEHRKRN